MKNSKNGKVIVPAVEPLMSSQTGITELDNVLAGGFLKGAVVLLAGPSGSGKTILSFQWLFNGIKNNENSVYITVSEPLFKTVKNLETLDFYDRNAIEQERLKLIDIREGYGKKEFHPDKLLNFIEKQVKENNAKRLCIDSITAIAYQLESKSEIRRFIFELGTTLAALGCTTILTSESEEKFSVYGVEEFISDAIIKLYRKQSNHELQRMIMLYKIRGRDFKTEELIFKIIKSGITVFPRLKVSLEYPSSAEKLSTGNEMLDKMLLGGIIRGSTTLVAGPSGTGKSLLSMQFINEGVRKGEPSLYVGFEESKDQLVRNAKSFGWNFEEHEKKGLLTLRCTYPSHMSSDEHLIELKQLIEFKGIKRCVVDSLSAIEHVLMPESFDYFARTLNAYLKSQGVTTLFTRATEMAQALGAMTEARLSTMLDNIIILRHVEMQGTLRLVLNIIKVRGSGHSKGLRMYDITEKGIVIGQSLVGYESVTTGVTRKISESIDEQLEAEFRKVIGPLAPKMFSEIKEKGLTRENIFEFIDKLAKDKILSESNSRSFKTSIGTILGTSVSEGEWLEKVEPQQETKAEKGWWSGMFG